MFRKRVWVPILIVLLTVMGCGLFYGRQVAKQSPVKRYNPVEVDTPAAAPKPPPPGESQESGHWHGDEWHPQPHETHSPAPPPQAAVPPAVEAQAPRRVQPTPPAAESPQSRLQSPERDPDFVNPTSTSSTPLFADGVPEHLQCPPELIGAYFKEISSARIKQLQQIGIEILESWNPNRPLTEVYPAFIEAERGYHANVDPDRSGLGTAGNRIDWQFQSLLDFPEIGVLAQEDTDRAFKMRMVELGIYSPDHNMLMLADGSSRTFRTDADKQYVFTWSNYTETADGSESNTFTHTSGPANGDPNAEVIHINLDEITDEELEALSGWNYNINPYTSGHYKLGDNR